MKLQETATETDRAEVVQVALDYFEGWFEGDPTRMERAASTAGQALASPGRPRLCRAAERHEGADGRLDGRRRGEEVRAPGYREYLHLVRTEASWKIVNALWHWT